MYIGPQGIVHGTTITLLNAARMKMKSKGRSGLKLFVYQGWANVGRSTKGSKNCRNYFGYR